MTGDRRRHLATPATAVLAFGVALAAGRDAFTAPTVARPPAEELLRVASDEPISVRFGSSVRASRVGSNSFRIAREPEGTPARGRYVAGTFLLDPSTGAAVVVDPEAYRETMQVVRGLDRNAAGAFVDRTLARYAKSGRDRDIAPLRQAVQEMRASFSFGRYFDPNLAAPDAVLRSLPQQDTTASAQARALRTIQAGDDALWDSYIGENNVLAFETLSNDPRAARFHHSIDPLTGVPREQSDYRLRENRRCLFTGAKPGRLFTFVADVPQTAALVDVAYTANARYTVTLAGLPSPVGGLLAASGYRMAVRRRVAHFETANPQHDATMGGPYGAPVVGPQFALTELRAANLRIVDVTPPDGEQRVDPSTDWENPDNRFITPLSQRRPFVARVRFNQPLDPRSVSPTTFTLFQTRAQLGTADERIVDMPVPADVRLNQSRLGDVEVEVAPHVPLDPAAEYSIRAINLVRSLDGRSNPTDFFSTFTTASVPNQLDVFFDEFKSPAISWREADTPTPRLLVAADATHDPAGLGRFAPFLGGDTTPVAAIESSWLDSRGTAPRYVMHSTVHEPAGSSVRVLARTTISNLPIDGPNLFLVGPWIDLTPTAGELIGGRFVQLRIEFTLPPSATPSTVDLPYVERLTVVGLRP